MPHTLNQFEDSHSKNMLNQVEGIKSLWLSQYSYLIISLWILGGCSNLLRLCKIPRRECHKPLEQNDLASKRTSCWDQIFFSKMKKIEEEIKVGKHRRVTHRQFWGSDREYKIGLCSLFEKNFNFFVLGNFQFLDQENRKKWYAYQLRQWQKKSKYS